MPKLSRPLSALFSTTYYSRCPSLNLKGNWLEEAGFATDTPVTVTVEGGGRTADNTTC
ncbi:SymE family type I addiction module toxin [Candidatus Pantoea soli]|uniref:Type I toxin-antitoxin system SymE family toxin n=1 Tax=Candidatus Pantoea soli TaxID=3098669 RepID=A0A518XIE9_9GAMM|nr:SymE family type I addiction module toxin [Pantoea soli]QDY43949.1 type I toxin-antitoxin system SymE family toxin [Pantoea soli]